MTLKPFPNGDERRPDGTFAPGNGAARGHRGPRAATQRIRSLIRDAVTDDDVTAIFGELIRQAKSGDTQAAKVVLCYVLGRPVDVTVNQRLDGLAALDELDL